MTSSSSLSSKPSSSVTTKMDPTIFEAVGCVDDDKNEFIIRSRVYDNASAPDTRSIALKYVLPHSTTVTVPTLPPGIIAWAKDHKPDAITGWTTTDHQTLKRFIDAHMQNLLCANPSLLEICDHACPVSGLIAMVQRESNSAATATHIVQRGIPDTIDDDVDDMHFTLAEKQCDAIKESFTHAGWNTHVMHCPSSSEALRTAIGNAYTAEKRLDMIVIWQVSGDKERTAQHYLRQCAQAILDNVPIVVVMNVESGGGTTQSRSVDFAALFAAAQISPANNPISNSPTNDGVLSDENRALYGKACSVLGAYVTRQIPISRQWINADRLVTQAEDVMGCATLCIPPQRLVRYLAQVQQ